MLAMKKLILILAVVAFATTAWAQETPKKPSFAGFVSNGFWDNWEMSLGGGVGTALTNGSNSGSFGKRLGFEANFSLVKWVHPVVGMRLQLQGGQFANYDADLGKLKWPYLFVHSDFMLNFSNWAGGYRDDRAYYLVPFVGFGYLATNFTDKSQEDNMTGTHQAFAFSYGLLNKFRLSRSFDFNIELKGMLAPSRVCPAKTDGSYLFGFSAAAAAVATVVAADEAALADTSIILFDYSMSVLTPQEKTRLELIAEQIKSGSKDAVYQIVGHADQQTGTAAGNKRVAEHRAKRVYDFLVSKGVNPKQLNYEGKGNSPDPFKKVQAANRAAIIQ